jgi:uncharacterized protein YndB with AHSA1/START domain
MVNESNQDQIIQEIFVEAPPDIIYQALTDPEQLTNWWGDDKTYHCDSWKVDLKIGGTWQSKGKGIQGDPFSVEGEYLEIDPPKVLSYTWNPSWHKIPPTKVRWVLTPQGTGTLVQVTHSGFRGNVEALENHKGGWPSVLNWLRNYAATKADAAKPQRH